MGRRRARMPIFTIGDFVFAKVRGYRAWPARILNRVGATAYNVYFYGTCNYAKVPRNEVVDFEKNQRRLGVIRAKGYNCNPTFRGAMMHARQAFANPDEDFGYYQQLAVENGDCVDAEDLELEYMVTEDGSNLQQEHDANEQVAVDQDEEVNSLEQVFSNQMNEPDSEEPALDCQLEEQEASQSMVLKKQVSEPYYSMAELVSLKSKKLMDTPIDMSCQRHR
uniref:GG17011 n=1 Tax=Drosophila erecta TaxID=7220 RepID=B3P138_DROER